jgi:superfamily II RNA helicase
VERLRAALRAHPCHRCPDREEHARWAERHARLARETGDLRRRMEGRTGSLGRRFDRICALLEQRGYLSSDEATPAGRQLARIWSESDLVVIECLRAGIWDRLEPAELAAVVSTLVYEPRRDERAVDRMPTTQVRDALAETTRIWAALADEEEQSGLPLGSRGTARPCLERQHAGRFGAVGRRLHPLVQAGARPARSAGRRAVAGRRSGTGVDRRAGGRCRDSPRRGRTEYADLRQ